jgi:prophage regulatory protein
MDHINEHCTLVRLKAVLVLLPISRSSWYAGIKAGRFPQPIKLGPRVSAWRLQDILALFNTDHDEGEHTPPNMGKRIKRLSTLVGDE